MKNQSASVMIDTLESRTLLSGGGHHFGGDHGHGHGGIQIPDPPSATVQADLDAIKADKAQLETDHDALKDTLKADVKALRAAVKAVDVTAEKAQFKTDAQAARDTLKADRDAIRAARKAGDSAALDAARAQFETDFDAAKTTLKADADAIKAKIDADPAVVAAKDQLTTDSQPITDDLAKLKADKDKLVADIKAGA